MIIGCLYDLFCKFEKKTKQYIENIEYSKE